MTFLDEIKQIDEKYQQVLATSNNLKRVKNPCRKE